MNLKIKTDRLILMPPTLGDVQRIAQLVGDKDVSWMLGRVPHPYSEEDARWWVNKTADDIEAGTEYAFGVYLPGVGLIGSCGLIRRGNVWEIGYWFGKPYWEQGFATEAGLAVLDWAREEMLADAFIAGHIRDNASSGRVLRKLGFQEVGEKMMYAAARGERVPALRFALNASAEAALAPDSHGDCHD